MDNDQPSSPFYKALMTGVFVGFVVTIVCLFYNIFYRGSTDFIPADIINVSSLIFGVNTLFVLVGLAYSLFRKAAKGGDLIHMAVFVLLTLFCVWKAQGAVRSDDPATNTLFRGLLTGIILIVGLSASFVIPFLFHNKTFEQELL